MKDEFDSVTGEIPELPFIHNAENVTPVVVGVNQAAEVPFIRSAWNYDRDAVSAENGLECLDPSLAQQHMAEDADINTIVKRFGLTGQMPSGARLPQYGDFVGIGDYRTALEAVQAAQDDFMELPADLRARFSNDPQLYLDFVENPSNQEEIYNLGLAERPRTASPLADAPQAPANPDSGSAA